MQNPGRENFSYRQKGNDSAKVNWGSTGHCSRQGSLHSSGCIRSDLYSLNPTFSPNWSILAKCFYTVPQVLYSLSAGQVQTDAMPVRLDSRGISEKPLCTDRYFLAIPLLSASLPTTCSGTHQARSVFKLSETEENDPGEKKKKFNMFYIILER